MKRTHPISILYFVLHWIYLLFIPLLQRLLTQGPEALFSMWQELFLAAALLGVAWLRWFCLTWRMDAQALIVSSGILWRQKTVLPVESITSADIEDGILLHLTGALRVRFAAEGGKLHKLSLLLPKKQARALFALGACAGRKRARGRSILLCALAASNFSLGLLLAAPVIEQVGTVFDVDLQSQLLQTLTQAQQWMARYFPPVFTALGYIMLAGWLVGVLYLAGRTAHFTLEEYGTYWRTRRGLFVGRETILRQNLCAAAIVRRTPALLAFGWGEARAVCRGYGEQRGELPLLMPGQRMEEQALALHVPKRAKFRCYLPLLFLSIALSVVTAYLILWFPGQKRLIALLLAVPLFLTFFSALPLWERMRFSGVSDDLQTLCTTRNFTRLTIRVEEGRVGALVLKTSPGQRELGVCDLTLVLRTEKRYRYTAKNLDEREVKGLIGKKYADGTTDAM